MIPISENFPDIDLRELRRLMTGQNVRHLLVKELAANDTSKNQPYLSGSLDVTNALPIGDIYVDVTPKGNRILKAPLPLSWLTPEGLISDAPHAKLILYPQYPEVRFSGFLRGSLHAPASLMSRREAGRLLFFGITDNRTIVAWAAGSGSRLANEIRSFGHLEQVGVFQKIPIKNTSNSTRSLLTSELRRVHKKGWIDSKKLSRNGKAEPYLALNAVGYTLEAELGIATNSRAEPDFMGWEVKAAQLGLFSRPSLAKALTLMTPNPTGGYYRTKGPESFVRRFGYSDTRGRSDRLNFGGIFRVDERHDKTKLTLAVSGFDVERNKITNAEGAILLLDDNDVIAAEWSYISLLNLWNRKHAQAVYVYAQKQDDNKTRYRYGNRVRLGEGTSFHRLISAVAGGRVYYDPGIKLVNASTDRARIEKSRSQFRVRFGDLPSLYDSFTEASVYDSNKHGIRK